jgi:hypothetical protein
MIITVDIPDELVKTVYAIFKSRVEPDDDGLTDVNIMCECGVTVEQYVKAENYYYAFRAALAKAVQTQKEERFLKKLRKEQK